MYFFFSPYSTPFFYYSPTLCYWNSINRVSFYNFWCSISRNPLRFRQACQSEATTTTTRRNEGADLCVWVCLPHKMAPGSANGPWKWLLSGASSALYRLSFFMWQLQAAGKDTPGVALSLRAVAAGAFCIASCGHWPPFHLWACSPAPQSPRRPQPCPRGPHAASVALKPPRPPDATSLPVGGLVGTITRVAPPPSAPPHQNGGDVLGLSEDEFFRGDELR